MDTDILPNQLEYWGPSGIPWFRNIQVRWMPIRSDRFHLMFGVERPGASADQGAYAGRVELQGVVPKFDMPDFTWQTRVTQKSGHVQLAGLFRKITWVDTAPNPQFKLGDTVLGWGLNLSSNLNFTEKSVGRFDVIYGEGIENYINDAPVDVGVKNNPANPIRPISGVPLLPRILAEMIMAGLYDGSGSWAWHVGVPAKSGVGGGILAVVPGKGAMAVFAPPLDEAGNSVKAQKAIAYVADKLGINLFSPASVGLK